MGIWDSRRWRKEATKSNSKSLKSCKNLECQLCLSPIDDLTNKDAIEASLSLKLSYKTRKTTLNDWSPHQQSCQMPKANLVTNTNLKVHNWHPILMLFHKPHPWIPGTGFVLTPHSSLNFDMTTRLHKCVSSIPNHHNFLKRAWLNVAGFLIPRHPLTIGVHTLSHPPQPMMFELVPQSSPQKFLYDFSILSARLPHSWEW